MIVLRKIFFFAFIALLLSLTAAAQDMLFPLKSNPAIKSYLETHKTNASSVKARIAITGDTLILPFIDDFSYDGVYPSSDLWTDSNVFINRDYPVDPPTIGVATFDGLDALGNPYSPGALADDIADHLTSKYINLDYPGDTTIWLSFFYQPQGLGEEPDPQDSLMLEFKKSVNDTVWNTVWQVAGSSLTPFRQALVHVDTSYLSSSFRFRFTNIANLNGNVDHWHLDFVKLKRDRSATDTAITDETTFLYRNQSLLVPPFTSMPYSHYKTNPAQYTVTSESADYKNLTGSPQSLNHNFRVYREDGTLDSPPISNAFNVNAFSAVSSPLSFTYVYPSLPQASLKYTTLNINTSPHGIQQNDSVREVQVLDNYYAYDDGTAERGYGVQGAAPNAALAVRFDLVMADTLRGVSIYWNQVGPDVHSHLLAITIWDQITVNTNNSHVLYRMIDQKPVNDTFPGGSSNNNFYTYVFDQPVIVSGTIYVGWVQDETDLLNVGFDRNTDTHDHIYVNYLNLWQHGGFPGSVMLRPLFGGPLNVGVKEVNKSDYTISVYPNPADKKLTVYGLQSTGSANTFELYNILGERVSIHREESENSKTEAVLDVSSLADGIYILKATDTVNKKFTTTKILVSHQGQ